MFAAFKMGMGGRKLECQDSFCKLDKVFSGDCYFMAVYDGHG